MTTFEIPTVATDRLRLRAFQASDLDAYAAMQANPAVMRHMVMGRTSTRVEVCRTMATSLGSWQLRGYGMWACEKIDDRAFVGSVGIFHPLDWPEPEIAYSLDRPYWGQGFATEAAGAARDWLPCLGLRASFGPKITRRNASWKSLVRFASVHSNCVARPMSGGCITGLVGTHDTTNDLKPSEELKSPCYRPRTRLGEAGHGT